MLTETSAENLLQAWGRHLAEEIEGEVGYPRFSPSCRDFESPPEWTPPPPGGIRPGDVERACAVMLLMRVRYKRLHGDLREHYRDGRRLSWERLRTGRGVFVKLWTERVEAPLQDACTYAGGV